MSVLGAGGKLRRSFRRFGVWEEAEEENPSQVSESESKQRDGSMDGGMDMDQQGQEGEPPFFVEVRRCWPSWAPLSSPGIALQPMGT